MTAGPDSLGTASSLNGNNFREVLAAEHEKIASRRAINGREAIMPTHTEAGQAVFNTTGVCLSGGGIRSAAFCLGALQALAVKIGIENIDYLSTVSGGGYIGSSVSAGMTCTSQFPFAEAQTYGDGDSVGHLRDYSNYLFPRGHKHSFVDAAAVVLRGLATNLIYVLAVVFLGAWVTLLAYPTMGALHNGSFLPRLFARLIPGLAPSLLAQQGFFPLTLILLKALIGILVVWAIWRSSALARGGDVRGPAVKIVRYVLIFILFAALLDFQPLCICWFLWLQAHESQSVRYMIAGASSLSATTAVFADKLATFLKTNAAATGIRVTLLRASTYLGLWIAALVLPAVIWLSYLWLCANSLRDCATYTLLSVASDLSALIIIAAHSLSNAVAAPLESWVRAALSFQFSPLGLNGVFGTALGLTALLFGPNANSLNRLYRDKLSKAFLFDPDSASRKAEGADVGDLAPLDSLKLSAISPASGGPYQLINAALNLQNSKHANRSGRNADFFLFSSCFVGSDATGYVDTVIAEEHDPHLDLATAMAISGAAISSNMGSASIRGLAPTLALLNIRLGYWLANPKYLRGKRTVGQILSAAQVLAARFWQPADVTKMQVARAARNDFYKGLRDRWKAIWRRISSSSKLYLVSEMVGNLDETHPLVYLTDGGHIENLGVYQLLKRRCRIIVAVDAEADPKMEFRAISTAQRYARIDLGVRIDLPWQRIAEVTKNVSDQSQGGRSVSAESGPHCALGTIAYENGGAGLLLYFKSSLSGDESDYVLDYKRRNPSFPHETTGDQFFSEEQFEAYRALGFHAVESFFRDDQSFVWASGSPGPLQGVLNPADARAMLVKGIAQPLESST